MTWQRLIIVAVSTLMILTVIFVVLPLTKRMVMDATCLAGRMSFSGANNTSLFQDHISTLLAQEHVLRSVQNALHIEHGKGNASDLRMYVEESLATFSTGDDPTLLPHLYDRERDLYAVPKRSVREALEQQLGSQGNVLREALRTGKGTIQLPGQSLITLSFDQEKIRSVGLCPSP